MANMHNTPYNPRPDNIPLKTHNFWYALDLREEMQDQNILFRHEYAVDNLLNQLASVHAQAHLAGESIVTKFYPAQVREDLGQGSRTVRYGTEAWIVCREDRRIEDPGKPDPASYSYPFGNFPHRGATRRDYFKDHLADGEKVFRFNVILADPIFLHNRKAIAAQNTYSTELAGMKDIKNIVTPLIILAVRCGVPISVKWFPSYEDFTQGSRRMTAVAWLDSDTDLALLRLMHS